MMLETILSKCDARYDRPDCEQCGDCSYGGCCPHDCEKCLDYIHNPNYAPDGASERKYDCTHLAAVRVLTYLQLTLCERTKLLFSDKIEYRRVDYSKHVWHYVHRDIARFQTSNCCIKFFYQDACDLIHKIASGTWTPNLIVFQYVFSDMQKHSSRADIEDFIDTFSEYFNSKVPSNTYIVLNDVNLGCNYGGGREYFDILLNKLKNVRFDRGHFHNDNGKGYYADGYPYRREFPENTNRFNLSPWKNHSPFDTCASAQMIIKKVVEE